MGLCGAVLSVSVMILIMKPGCKSGSMHSSISLHSHPFPRYPGIQTASWQGAGGSNLHFEFGLREIFIQLYSTEYYSLDSRSASVRTENNPKYEFTFLSTFWCHSFRPTINTVTSITPISIETFFQRNVLDIENREISKTPQNFRIFFPIDFNSVYSSPVYMKSSLKWKQSWIPSSHSSISTQPSPIRVISSVSQPVISSVIASVFGDLYPYGRSAKWF